MNVNHKFHKKYIIPSIIIVLSISILLGIILGMITYDKVRTFERQVCIERFEDCRDLLNKCTIKTKPLIGGDLNWTYKGLVE